MYAKITNQGLLLAGRFCGFTEDEDAGGDFLTLSRTQAERWAATHATNSNSLYTRTAGENALAAFVAEEGLTLYRISSDASGQSLGCFAAKQPAGAYLAMLEDAGAYDDLRDQLRTAAAEAGDLEMVALCDSDAKIQIADAIWDGNPDITIQAV